MFSTSLRDISGQHEMAGKRQHYIPRFLQRGFLATSSQEAERTWLHRSGAAARLVGTRDVGVGENFYSKLSKDGTPTLDDLITALEGGLDEKLNAMRHAPDKVPVNSEVAAELVAHLMLRTAHVRSVFAQASTQLLDQTNELLTDPDRLRHYLNVDDDPSNTSIGLVGEVLKQIPSEALSLPPALMRRMIAFWIRERYRTLYEHSIPAMAEALSEIGRGILSTIREAHNRALTTADQSRWKSDLARLSWQTCSVTGAILSDCVVVARESGGTFAPLLLSERERIDLVVLPIAHNRLLVGSTVGDFNISVEAVNEASASCSDSFFVSRSADDAAGLSDLIGKRCAQAIAAGVNKALSELQRIKTGHVETSSERGTIEASASSSFTFSLTCTNFADAETVLRLGDLLKVIVQEVSRDMPLSALDGITFAADYASALEKLDRGSPALGIDQSQPRSYGRAVAKCVTVAREDAFKEHLVFDAEIAQGLLAEAEDDRAFSIHIVVGKLADIAHREMYEAQVRETSIASLDCITRWLHPGASAAPGRYFSARKSAFTYPRAGERYAKLFKDSFNSARESIQAARLAYHVDNNVDKLLEIAVAQTSFVLAHAAEWLGHRDGISSQEFPGSSLSADLKIHDLDLWLELFGEDLQRLYDGEGQFTSANVLSLGRHVERLLWTVQIFPWPMDNGSMYVTIPVIHDELALSAHSEGST